MITMLFGRDYTPGPTHLSNAQRHSIVPKRKNRAQNNSNKLKTSHGVSVAVLVRLSTQIELMDMACADLRAFKQLQSKDMSRFWTFILCTKEEYNSFALAMNFIANP